MMKKLLIALTTAAFVAAPAYAAADKKPADAKPTMEQCKKDGKLKGCDEVLKAEKKEKKAKGGC
jgi:Ni/Co efflux regulator RcnB